MCDQVGIEHPIDISNLDRVDECLSGEMMLLYEVSVDKDPFSSGVE